MNQQESIQFIKSILSNRSYGKERFEFLQEQKFDSIRIDLIIKAGKRNIAALEFTSPQKLENSIIAFTGDFYLILKIRYFIYTDGEVFYIFDRFKNPKQSVKTNVNGFVKSMIALRSKALLDGLKSNAAEIIIKKIIAASDQFPQVAEYAANLKSKVIRELKISSDYMLYFEGGKTDTDSFEHQFFRHLLNNDIPEYIYRYCAFSRAFQIVNDHTIAMLGLPGMNDTTEPNYVDNYLNESDEEPWDMPPQSRAAINRRFIMSCTILPDDLMQWRLYGEDGKGSCLKLQTKKMLSITQKFYLGRVKYADNKGRHPELLFLKSIINEIRKTLLFDIKFILLYVWRHFFKPHDYDYEKEIRLLYIHQKTDREKKWIIGEPYSIVNPMVIFDLSKNEFPLKITEVMLGPKRLERDLNKSQLEQLISEKKRGIDVTESVKNVYR